MKAGVPTYDFSEDEQAKVHSANMATNQLLYERVITRVFAQYAILLEISDNIRASFRTKLWRMGQKLLKLGSKSRVLQLKHWKEGKGATWKFSVSDTEVNRQLLHRKCQAENLEEEISKRQKM